MRNPNNASLFLWETSFYNSSIVISSQQEFHTMATSILVVFWSIGRKLWCTSSWFWMYSLIYKDYFWILHNVYNDPLWVSFLIILIFLQDNVLFKKSYIYICIFIYCVSPDVPIGGGVSRVQAFLFLKLDPFPSIMQYT